MIFEEKSSSSKTKIKFQWKTFLCSRLRESLLFERERRFNNIWSIVIYPDGNCSKTYIILWLIFLKGIWVVEWLSIFLLCDKVFCLELVLGKFFFVLFEHYHGQTLANRTKPGPSFQLFIWVCFCIHDCMYIIITAQLIVENSAQTSFRFSPPCFRAIWHKSWLEQKLLRTNIVIKHCLEQKLIIIIVA
jgi:hypothetical protein